MTKALDTLRYSVIRVLLLRRVVLLLRILLLVRILLLRRIVLLLLLVLRGRVLLVVLRLLVVVLLLLVVVLWLRRTLVAVTLLRRWPLALRRLVPLSLVMATRTVTLTWVHGSLGIIDGGILLVVGCDLERSSHGFLRGGLDTRIDDRRRRSMERMVDWSRGTECLGRFKEERKVICLKRRRTESG